MTENYSILMVSGFQIDCYIGVYDFEKQRMQNGVKIIFGKKFFTPTRLLIFVPMLKIIRQKKNAENPVS
jgi:hypothetical protein